MCKSQSIEILIEYRRQDSVIVSICIFRFLPSLVFAFLCLWLFSLKLSASSVLYDRSYSASCMSWLVLFSGNSGWFSVC